MKLISSASCKCMKRREVAAHVVFANLEEYDHIQALMQMTNDISMETESATDLLSCAAVL